MTTLLENVHFALPEMIILVTACLVLLADLFLSKRYASLPFIFSQGGLILSSCICFIYLGGFRVIFFGGLFVSDDIALLMKIFIGLSVFLGFLYSRRYLDIHHMPAGDYYVLGLLSMLGMMILVSAHSLLTIYLGLELLSLPLYAMTAMRRTHSDSVEAAMKYFVMGAIASGMLLYGLSLLYGATGKLDLLDIANTVAANWQQQNLLLSFALVFVLAGVGFKLAVIPFHMWAPDVYQGAPTSVSLFISTAPKIAAVGMALRLLTIGLVDTSTQWQQLLLVMALLSTGLGNLLAISQVNIKRLFAYSAISHGGYILFGIVAATNSGYAASLYYVLVYAVMTAAAFGLILLLSRRGLEVEQIDDLKGLNKRSPWLAFMMLLVMFSMAGIPPTVGFFTKLLVLKALVNVHLAWAAVLGLIFAVMGAYYYVRIIKAMYFDEPVQKEDIYLSVPTKAFFSLNCLSLLYYGIFPGSLITICSNAFIR